MQVISYAYRADMFSGFGGRVSQVPENMLTVLAQEDDILGETCCYICSLSTLSFHVAEYCTYVLAHEDDILGEAKFYLDAACS